MAFVWISDEVTRNGGPPHSDMAHSPYGIPCHSITLTLRDTWMMTCHDNTSLLGILITYEEFRNDMECGITVGRQCWMNRTMRDDVEHSVAYDVDCGPVKELS